MIDAVSCGVQERAQHRLRFGDQWTERGDRPIVTKVKRCTKQQLRYRRFGTGWRLSTYDHGVALRMDCQLGTKIMMGP